MTQRNRGSAPDGGPSSPDPWHAAGSLISGVALYGFLGWLADRWLGTSFLVAVGVLIGAILGLYLTITRFKHRPEPPSAQDDPPQDKTP